MPLATDLNLTFKRRAKRKAALEERELEEEVHLPSEEEEEEEDRDPPIERRDPSNVFLTEVERVYNPYASHPHFHGRCTFCSGGHCSRWNKAGTVANCKKLRSHLKYSPSRNICSYARCPEPSLHHTVVCPALHARCPVCGCRGHDERDRCDSRDAGVMSRLRRDFEESASLGFYTKRRFHLLAWGFYPVPSTCPLGKRIVSYMELTRMDVLPALKLVRDLALLPENSTADVQVAVPRADIVLGRSRLHPPVQDRDDGRKDSNNNGEDGGPEGKMARHY